jgi:hypothetical protein
VIGLRPHGGRGLVIRDRHSPPDLARLEVADKRPRPADVIGVAVGHDQIVDAKQMTRPERGPNYAIPEVELTANRQAAGVDDHLPAVRKRDEHRVALTDVHHREMK